MGTSAGKPCQLGARTLSDGEWGNVYTSEHGNAAGGPMNYDLCIASSFSVKCENGNISGTKLGSTTLSNQGQNTIRCFDNQASEDKLNSMFNKLYISILGRMPDASGLAYWKAQIRSSAVTMDDVTYALKKVATDGTDSIAKPTATLDASSRKISNINPTLTGTTTTSSTFLTIGLMLTRDMPAAKRIPYYGKASVANGKWSFTYQDTIPAGTYDYTIYDGDFLSLKDPNLNDPITVTGP